MPPSLLPAMLLLTVLLLSANRALVAPVITLMPPALLWAMLPVMVQLVTVSEVP